MFGPNNKSHDGEKPGDAIHHRQQTWRDHMSYLTKMFEQKFGLEDWYVVFITGGGTLANEIMVNALPKDRRIYVPWAWEKFGGRLYQQAHTAQASMVPPKHSHTAFVAYETSISASHDYNRRDANSSIICADMISAFPYYRPGDAVDMFTCVSGKQLGGLPGVGIICIRQEKVAQLVQPQDDVPLSLRLTEYLRPEWMGEGGTGLRVSGPPCTPFTPAIDTYYDLAHAVYNCDRDELVYKINQRRNWLNGVIEPCFRIGDGPVYTVKLPRCLKKDYFPEDIYRTQHGHLQLFLWSGTDDQYQQFCDDWRKVVGL